jgi:hypothetical protein
MKRIIASAVLGLSLALPNVSDAHGFHGGRGYYHHGPGLIGGLIALPFVVGAAVIGTAAAIATAPFNDGYYDQPGPGYYQPGPGYYQPAPSAYYPPQPAYYAPAPRVVYSQPPPVYYAPPPRVVYVQPRVVYRPYYAPPPPAYYEQAPSGY